MADLVGKIIVNKSITGKINLAKTMYENDYEQLVNLPRINGVIIIGDLSFEDLGLIFDGVTIVAGKNGVLFVKDNSHNHTVENISDFPEWANRDTKPEYTSEEVGADKAGSAQNALTSAKNYVDKIIEELVNGAPEMLDTLGELADAMENNQSAIEALEKIAASKASQTDLNEHINDKNNPHAVTKSTIGLGNVENKSSATIRGELTKENVTKALGYTPSESDTTYTEATQSKSGLLSAVDKTKLDGIENGAQKNTITGVKGNAESAYRTGQVNITPANIGAAEASHTHSNYLPLSGGTMTGDIKRTSGSYTAAPIAIYTGDANGAGMVIQMGGRIIIGSGESGANLRTALGTTAANEAAEIMYVASDNEIHLVTNCQTIANRKDVVISTAGNVNAPGGFTGSLSGNAATASKLQTARTINGVAFDGSQNITIPGDTGLTSKVNMKSKTSDIFRLF